MPIDLEHDTPQSALKKLKARENAFRQLEAISNLGSWEVDLKTKKSSWSKRSYEIYKIPYSEEVGLDTFFSLLLPQYHKEAQDAIDRGIKTQQPITFTGKVKRRDGEIIHILINAQVILDENSHPDKMIGTTQDITQYTQLQEHAKELSELLEHSSNEVYIIDIETLEYLYVNQGACDALGYTKYELLDMSIFDINPYLKYEEVLLLKNRLQQQKQILNRTIHQRKDGTLYHVQSYIHTLTYHGTDAYVIFDTDITTTIELELEHKRQANILQHIHDAVIATNMLGDIVSWNHGATHLFGYTLNDIKGKNITALYSAENATPVDTLLHLLQHNEKVEIEAWMVNKYHEAIICNLSITALYDDFNALEGYIFFIQDITKEKQTQKLLKDQAKRLEYQANHDLLTALPNRAYFKTQLTHIIEKAKQTSTRFALLFIDLDQFKQINDSLGHHVGDKVLVIAAKRFLHVLGDKGILSRLGGDEFTVILNDAESPQQIAQIAQQLIETIKEPIIVENHRLHVSSSIGISIFPDDTFIANNLIKYADTAMYKAKDLGRDNYQFYKAEMTQQAFERVLIENDLRIAITEKQFVVYFQPQFTAKSQQLVGMEALVRWQHPTNGLVAPNIFIHIAEETGLIVDIDMLVMEAAMSQYVTWYEQGYNPGILSLNLSMKQLAKENFIDTLADIIEQTNFNPIWLELEVTEGDVMEDPKNSIEKLVTLHELGIGIAIDDFGTGYSSLSYLKKLPLDKLKIDQSFVRDLPEDEEDAAITKAIIALGKSLKLTLIAEGVETNEQRDFLIKNGCDLIQGYLFSKPKQSQEIEDLLKLRLTEC